MRRTEMSLPGERATVDGVRRIVADPPGVLLREGDDSILFIGVVFVVVVIVVADLLP